MGQSVSIALHTQVEDFVPGSPEQRPFVGLYRDPAKSLAMLTSVVEKTSNPIGTVLLGVTLHDENTDPLPNGVLDRAFELVHAAALSDPRDPAYAHVVAMCYSDGIGTDVDNELALEWWRKAAAFGFVPAIESVSWAYGRGVGVPVDMIKCLNMSVTGVELGYMVSLFNEGASYALQENEWHDRSRALELFRAAAALGDPDAEHEMVVELYERSRAAKDAAALQEEMVAIVLRAGTTNWSLCTLALSFDLPLPAHALDAIVLAAASHGQLDGYRHLMGEDNVRTGLLFQKCMEVALEATSREWCDASQDELLPRPL